MAYTIVNKDITLNYTDEENNKINEKTIFSWVAIYKKQNGKWKTECVASTNQESITNIVN